MDESAASHLPVEIWIKVATTLLKDFPCKHGNSSIDGDLCPLECDMQDFRAIRPLSETCRFLCTIIQPMLYEYIRVDEGHRSTTKTINSVTATLMARPDLRSSVRILQLRNFPLGGQSALFLQLLPLLVEVRFLSLCFGTVSSAIAALLQNATHLHTLHMTAFRWEEEAEGCWASGGTFGARLQSFVFEAPDSHMITLVSPFFTPALKKLHTNSQAVSEYMQQVQGCLPFGDSLIEFTSKCYPGQEHQTTMVRLLSQCPKLVHISVEGLEVNVSMTSNDFLPNLQYIEGGPSLISALRVGRPIRSIKTAAHADIYKDTWPEIEELFITSIAISVTCIQTMLASFPNLVRLELRCCIAGGPCGFKIWMKDHIKLAVSQLSRLQILHVRWDRYDRRKAKPMEHPLSDKMLQELDTIVQIKQQHCPHLYDVWVEPEHAWTYESTDNIWVPRRRMQRWSNYCQFMFL